MTTNHSARAEQCVGETQRPYRIIAGAAAGVAETCAFPLLEGPAYLEGMKASIHAGKACNLALRRQCKLALGAEVGRIARIADKIPQTC